MKKTIKILMLTLLIISMFASNFTVFASEQEAQQAEWQDINLTQEEIDEILAGSTFIEPCATGLISSYALIINKDGSTLKIAGRTLCFAEVVKCGFKKVVIQRRANSSSSWSDYLTYTDIYNDAASCYLSKSITVPSGYQYRATCVHYAKKNILSVQKISNISDTLTF